MRIGGRCCESVCLNVLPPLALKEMVPLAALTLRLCSGAPMGSSVEYIPVFRVLSDSESGCSHPFFGIGEIRWPFPSSSAPEERIRTSSCCRHSRAISRAPAVPLRHRITGRGLSMVPYRGGGQVPSTDG